MNIHKKYNYTLYIYIASCISLWSCGEKDIPVPDEPQNKPVLQQEEASRIEVPRQKEGSHNQFIVKKAKLREDGNTMFVNFCMEYDQQKKSTRWTAFRWDMDNTYDSKCGRYGTYLSDPDVPKQYRVGSGYFQGYSRGHMLASEDRQCSASANKQTFFMTNMHPQFERFNGYDSQGDYVWLNAEKLARSLYQNWNSNDNGLDTIYVVKGGTIDKQEHILGYTSNNNSSKIIVPRYFYMAILYRHANLKTGEYWKAIALWIPHTEGDTTSGKDIAMKYAMSIDELEEKTDIDFFHNLPNNIEDNVEKSYSLNDWNWK